MNRHSAFLVLLIVLTIAMTSIFAQNSPDPMVLVETERAFGRAVADKGMNAGFLEFLADDGILFRPGPINGKQLLQGAEEAGEALLSWEPEYAEIASGGDMGWTTGPWNLRADKEAEPSRFGQYVSVWQMQPDGAFKLVLDIGVVFGEERAVDDLGLTLLQPASESALTDEALAAERDRLLQYDMGLSDACARVGIPEAYRSVAAEDILILRPGRDPIFGHDEMDEYLSTVKSSAAWKPQDAGVSLHGELGFTYGEGHYLPPGKSSEKARPFAYAALWRRVEFGRWELAVDVVTPLPEPQPGGDH